MKTLQAGSSPGTRIDAGNRVLDRAESVKPVAVKKRFAVFVGVHKLYSAAHKKALAADEALRKQQAKLAEADVDQDEWVSKLAAQLPSDGLPRTNPFKPLGFASASIIQTRAATAEAKIIEKLGAAVLKRKDISRATKTAANAAIKAAKAVSQAAEPLKNLKAARTSAMNGRDALEQAWETAFAALKRSVRTAEDDGAKGLFAALFDTKPKPKRAAKKTAAATPKANPSATLDV